MNLLWPARIIYGPNSNSQICELLSKGKRHKLTYLLFTDRVKPSNLFIIIIFFKKTNRKERGFVPLHVHSPLKH